MEGEEGKGERVGREREEEEEGQDKEIGEGR